MNIEIKNMHKKYKGEIIFENYNAVFKENEITCIIGKSGSGKTTLLRILMGLESIEKGNIYGIDDKRISVVFQENRLCENLSLILNLKLTSPEISEDEIKIALEKVKLDINNINKKVKEFSGGMRRRVAILRALFYEFDLLILDEPFKGLDLNTKVNVIEFMKEKIKNKTVIIVTHDLDELDLFEGFKIKLINLNID